MHPGSFRGRGEQQLGHSLSRNQLASFRDEAEQQRQALWRAVVDDRRADFDRNLPDRLESKHPGGWKWSDTPRRQTTSPASHGRHIAILTPVFWVGKAQACPL